MFYKMYRFFSGIAKVNTKIPEKFKIQYSKFLNFQLRVVRIVGNPSLRQSKWMQPRLGSTRMQFSLAAQFKLKTLLKL